MTDELIKQLENEGWKITRNGCGQRYEPSLSKLIKACGKSLDGLTRVRGGWICGTMDAYGDYINSAKGKTPKEAVAKFWLALNK